ncbi:MAG: SBBP repeat-containing protein [Lamprobacter sp.]|uniref:DUF7948 domain-containing protein n=1 Tax=Lamprobacter sp. TaxID=3100796 RepID=UPI002B257112|nr:SBBP repeat-containing protein [Lamprobacter sp.]MEA3640805.1 SBBP repeat-containing protein [Lamprobacter sp.]
MFHPLRLPNRARALQAPAKSAILRAPIQIMLCSAALLLVLAISPLGALATNEAATQAMPATLFTSGSAKPLPLQFVPNIGQWQQEDLLYLTRAADVDALFKRDHIELRGRDPEGQSTLRLRPLGAETADLQPGAKRVTVVNDYRGQDPARWHIGIPTYEDLRYVGLYPDIDLALRTHERQLAYDFILHPGADPARIRVAVEGAQALSVEPDGSLLVTLADGRILRQQAPFIYQERDGEREPVSGRFQLLAANASEDSAPVYGFEVGDYDPNWVLVIDPTLEYANFVGGSGDERVSGMHVMTTGEVIVVGTTSSANFAEDSNPREIGPEDGDGTVSLGRDNGFVYKVNTNGSLAFVTLLGGGSSDALHDLAVDSSDNIYVAGSTSSNDFPLVNPLFGVLTGRSDAFVTKLNSTGQLDKTTGFSTYYGGNGETSANAVAIDDVGDIYIAGVTAAPDLVLRNPLYPTLSGGRGKDGFIAQFALNGNRASLEYATYFGGSRDDSIDKLIVSNSLDTAGRSLASDTGDLFFVGRTASPATDRNDNPDFPRKHALQAELGGRQDGFLARIARGGQELVFSTYVGGSNEDVIADFAIDAEGNYLLAGYTSSADWPTQNAMIPDYPAGSRNKMGTLAKIDKSGRFRHFATYLGAAGNDQALAVAAGKNSDGEDVIYVAGITDSNAFPTQNAYQGYHAGNGDGFLAILDGSGQAIRNSSYFGGGATDEIIAIRPADPVSDLSVSFAGNTQELRSGAPFPDDSTQDLIAPHAGRLDTFVAQLDLVSADLGPRLPVLWLGSDDDATNPIYKSDTIYPPSVNGTPAIGFVLRLEDRPALAKGIISFSTRVSFDPEVLANPDLDWENTDGSSILNDPSITKRFQTLGVNPDTGMEEWEISVFQRDNDATRIDTGLDDDQLATISFSFVPDQADIAPQEVVVSLQEVASAAIEGDLDAVISGLPGTRFVDRRCNDILGDCDCSGQVQLFELQSAETYFTNDPAAAPICLKSNYVSMTGTDLDTVVTTNYLGGVTEPDASGGGGSEEGGELGVSESMGMGTLAASSAHGMSLGTSTSERLDFVSPQISGSTVSYDLILNASEEPSVLSADIYYDPAHVEDPSAITGTALSSVGKQVVYNVVEPGWLRLVAYGINRTTIPDGILATVELKLAPGSTIDDLMLEMKAAAAIPSLGHDIDLHSNGVEDGHFVIQMVSDGGARARH